MTFFPEKKTVRGVRRPEIRRIAWNIICKLSGGAVCEITETTVEEEVIS
jgi:hypothetical protein